MQGGRLRIEGESVDTSKDEGSGAQGPDEVFDGAGNKIEAGQVWRWPLVDDYGYRKGYDGYELVK